MKKLNEILKSYLFPFLVVIYFSSCGGSLQFTRGDEMPAVAILDFIGESYLFSNDDVEQALTYSINSTGLLKVVDRNLLNHVMLADGIVPTNLPDAGLYSRIGRAIDADFVILGRIVEVDYRIERGTTIPLAMYLPKVSLNIELELWLVDAKKEELELIKSFSKKNSISKRVQFFSFDSKHPNLYPSVIDRERLVRRTLEELSESISEEVHKVIFSS